MTPTLFGRWQTRIFLLITFGNLVSLPFYLGLIGEKDNLAYFWIVFWVGIFGLAWDVLYNYLQQYMWDRDWPGFFVFLAGIVEGIFLALILGIFGLPGVPNDEFNLASFIVHYGLVWLAVYISSWTAMRVLFPRWRFRGGEWIGRWPG
jgi:hypothetical protein